MVTGWGRNDPDSDFGELDDVTDLEWAGGMLAEPGAVEPGAVGTSPVGDPPPCGVVEHCCVEAAERVSRSVGEEPPTPPPDLERVGERPLPALEPVSQSDEPKASGDGRDRPTQHEFDRPATPDVRPTRPV